jgi:membrane dipeptidase
MPGRERQRGLTRRRFLATAAASAAASGACSGRRREAPSDAALELHRQSSVFDLHVDTLLWQRVLGYDITARHEPWLPFAAFLGHMDLPRAAEGGLDGAVLGLVVSPQQESPEQLWALKLLARLERGRGSEQALDTLDLLARVAERHPQAIAFARTGRELREAIRARRFAALAGLEGAHGVEGSIDKVRAAWDRGLRMLGLVHFQASGAGYPMTAPCFEDRGLTPFGFDLLAEMESLPMVVDLAHLNARGIDDALAAAAHPCVVSHSACEALHPNPRNLDDSSLRAIAERGGVVGLAVGRSFLGPGGLEAFVAHASHLRRVAGEDAVALGSDWDGGIVPVTGLEDVRGLPWLTQGLLEANWKPQAIQKLLGENALRVLTDVLG